MPTNGEKKKAAGKQTWMYSKQCRLLEKKWPNKKQNRNYKVYAQENSTGLCEGAAFKIFSFQGRQIPTLVW